jgi:hypothetical protein
LQLQTVVLAIGGGLGTPRNLLTGRGDVLFLEIIAPNPDAPAPAGPRWFALDSLRPDSKPALCTWVARKSNIRATASACSEALGSMEPMSPGALNWLITIAAHGALPLNGIAPAFIEWKTDIHPAAKLQDHGLSLVRLELFHPEPERISRLLRSIGLEGPVAVSLLRGARVPYLVAQIDTPNGLRSL